MINLQWQPATITAIISHSPLIKSFHFTMSEPWSFLAGQHCAIRLTSPDGYQVARDYSLSSSPISGVYEITIEKLPSGEVSSWFHAYAEVGDTFEVIGPVGGFGHVANKKLLLIAGNVGITPLISIVRNYPEADFRLLWSATSQDYLCFQDEVAQKSNVEIRLTNHQPENYLQAKDFLPYFSPDSQVIIVGSAGFVATIKKQLMQAQFITQQIMAETFFDT